MARSLGLGVTPWSPLRAGILSGKYRRDSRPEVGTTRVTEDSPHLSERNYAIIDELVAIAEDLEATPAQVALRWLQDRDGVASTIIGARRKDQLLDNLGALTIALSPEQTARLDAVSEVEHAFPHPFLANTPHTTQGGAVVNGFESTQAPFLPQTNEERW